jgi:enoyl-CoA hydratase
VTLRQAQGDRELIVETEGHLGRIRLNRPQALHALTTAMCHEIVAALDTFEGDDGIAGVLIDHASGRGFCAGGDIRMLSDSVQGDGVAARAFFHAEYRMNDRLFCFAKPSVAVMDGIAMGGGVGIAWACRHRVATENTRFAMPETGIGLFPDVGGGWHLPRLAGQVGKFMGLTGARLDGAECVALGLATHFVPQDRLPELASALYDRTDFEATLDALSVEPPPARIAQNRERIDQLFAGATVGEIMAALEADGGDWALKELATLKSKSPRSMAVALRQLREGAAMADFADVMAMEYRIAVRTLAHPDFVEGVRAVVIDKDNAPRWVPEVTEAEVDAAFAPLPPDQEWRPLSIRSP